MEKEEKKNEKPEVVLKEEKILKFWQESNIFKKTLDKDAPKGNFVFYDGPPFATGVPHYGHLLPGTVKDIIPRYQTMKGKKVLRKWGWDCHGLPIENLIEKELNLSSKKDIETYGIAKFNSAAKDSVMRYADEWKKTIPRVGRWVDMEDDYKTMDSKYTESVWWSFKSLYDKGLVHQGFKSMHICPRCETTLSNFEINQGYKDITDISVYVKFEVVNSSNEAKEENIYFLAWTTTPWTLPGNVALAINKDATYVKAKKEGMILILAKDLAAKVLKENYEILEEFAGQKLLGKSYKPLFPYYDNPSTENIKNGFKVYHADFVTMEDGTGIVHIAPAFGEDDMNLGKKENLPFIQHVGTDGTFKKEVTDFAGLKVKPIEDPQKTDVEIIKYLSKNGTLFQKEKIIHSYPHCWRCETPLLNYASSSWFVKVTNLKDKMVELNKEINWVPEDVGEGRFGKWLEGARDWAVSRSRYWGAPIPVWQNEKGEKIVVGSLEDLRNAVGRRNTYYLIRHGESEGNLGDIISSDPKRKDPLTQTGKDEVKASAKTLSNEKIDLIISSPFERTRETAEIIAEEIGMDRSKIIFDDRLKEIDCGGYDGKPWKEYESARYASKLEWFNASVSGSETFDELRLRSLSFMYDIDSKYEGKNILIVSHGGPLNLIVLASKGMPTKDIIKHYYDNPFYNAEIAKCDFVSLPHNESFEIDLHRPYIDGVEIRGKDGSLFKRVSEVFDCWYESGSMFFAEHHYPFENKDLFEKKNSPLFPADFIAESLDQTRGWFYTMLVLSTGLFGETSYKNVVVSGMVLAEDGRKMSKHLKNYPDINYLIDKYGADSLRYYLMSSPAVKAEDINFSEKGVDEVYKKIVQKIYNVLSFYEMYKTPYKKDLVLEGSVLDKWIMSRLAELRDEVTKALDSYELDKAARPFMDFVDELSTWYIRRSRDRFKSENQNEKETVSNITAFILCQLAKIMAPFMPFLAEELYLKITGGEQKESVHLEDWPELEEITRDPEIIELMYEVRSIVSSALELRQKAGIKVRQPLKSVKINLPAEAGNQKSKLEGNTELLDLIKDELNVKEVIVDEKIEADFELDTNITEELKEEGIAREIIRAIQDVRKKENLNPSDKIKIAICTTDNIKSIINKYISAIKTPTSVTEIEYTSNKLDNEIEIDGGKISLSITHI